MLSGAWALAGGSPHEILKVFPGTPGLARATTGNQQELSDMPLQTPNGYTIEEIEGGLWNWVAADGSRSADFESRSGAIEDAHKDDIRGA